MTLNMTTKSNATLDILCNNNSSLNTNSTTNNLNQDDNLCEDMMMGEAPKILKLADIGYSISLITLVLALIILTCVRRLRSPRNNLHLQLFISFIIRCSLHLIKRLFLEQMYMSGACRIVTVIWQYSLLANYNWILMEAVYLHSLIFVASVSPYGPAILGYVVFGWTMPLVCMIPWVIVKAKYEDSECWLTNDNEAYFWITRGPITISILINFIIYIRIVLMLYSKIFPRALQISKRSSENNYKRLVKSTLVLIPLFGVHYTALLILQQWAEFNNHELAKVVWLYTETLFSSLQGSIVAFLYCFLNDEVHQEIKRIWSRSN